MSLRVLIIVAVIGQITGVVLIYLVFRAALRSTVTKLETLMKSVQVMVNTLNLQREDNSAMLLAAQVLRRESAVMGIEDLPFKDVPDLSTWEPPKKK